MGRCIFAWQAECLACVLFQTENHGRTVIRQFLSFCRHSRVARAAIASYVHVCSHRCHCLSCGSRFVPVVWLSSQAQYFRNVVCLWNWINLLFLGVIAVQFNSPPFNASILSSGDVSRVLLWHGLSVVHCTSPSMSPHQSTSHNHISSQNFTSNQVTSHHIDPALSHHITSFYVNHHITSRPITLHHITSHHVTSLHIKSQTITWHDIAWHDITSPDITWHGITSHHFISAQ